MSELSKILKNKYKDFDIIPQHLGKVLRDNNKIRKRTRHKHFPEHRYGKKISKKKELNKFYKEIKKYKLNKIISIDETSSDFILSHGALICKKCSALWNRDENSSRNIYKIVYNAINKKDRPEYLSRSKNGKTVISGTTSVCKLQYSSSNKKNNSGKKKPHKQNLHVNDPTIESLHLYAKHKGVQKRATL